MREHYITDKVETIQTVGLALERLERDRKNAVIANSIQNEIDRLTTDFRRKLTEHMCQTLNKEM